MPSSIRFKLLSVTAVAMIGGAGGCHGRDIPTAAATPDVPAPHIAAASAPVPVPSGLATMADVAERSVTGVVNISSERVVKLGGQPFGPFFSDPFFREFFGDRHGLVPQERRQRSLGSGVIVSKDGVIVTNHHVVRNADKIRVGHQGHEYEVDVVGGDPGTDIAVLRLKKPPSDLVPLELGDSDDLRLGEIVLAVGNPFGVGQTVTMGIVSAKGRANMGLVDYEDFIQTDAAINPGNSGGALVNLHGKVVGINTAIVSRGGGYQGVGFAVPTKLARDVMNKLLTAGKVSRGWLGVTIQDVDDALRAALSLPATKGVLVADVAADSPASRAGVLRGDLIVKLNDTATDDGRRLRNAVAALGPGASARVTVIRGGKTRTLSVTLGEKPEQLEPETRLGEPGSPALAGLTATDLARLSKAQRTRLRIPDKVTKGVVILGVVSGSAGDAAGLRIGDVIVEANRKRITSVRQLRAAFDRAGQRAVPLLIYRGGTTLYLAFSAEAKP